MFSLLRSKFGIPGVIAVVALVFAMLGGAYAASNNGVTASAKKKSKSSGKLTASQKKEVESIAKKFQGTGPAGKDGNNGSNGSNGANGAPGAPGAPGKSIELTSIPVEELECEERGGALLQEEGSSEEVEICNGSPWAAGGTLPKGATETGAWGSAGGDNEGNSGNTLASISFALPLSAPLPAANVSFIPKDGTVGAECNDGNAGNGAPGPGNPEADPGFLCVFQGGEAAATEFSSLVPAGQASPFATAGASTSGAVLILASASVFGNWGTFAVTESE